MVKGWANGWHLIPFLRFFIVFFSPKYYKLYYFIFLVFVENFVENVKKPPFLTLFDGAKSGQIPVFHNFSSFFHTIR